jgi:hypothetical protein
MRGGLLGTLEEGRIAEFLIKKEYPSAELELIELDWDGFLTKCARPAPKSPFQVMQ